MADVFRRKGSGDWHCKIRRATNRQKMVRLCSDKGVSRTWRPLLQNAVDRMNAGEPPEPGKLKGIPRRCLESLGLVSELAGKRRASWTEHKDDYVGGLKTLGRKKKYIDNTDRAIRFIGEECGWKTLSDVNRNRYSQFLKNLRDDDKSPRTMNNMTATIKGFLDWAVNGKRMDENPLAPAQA